MAAWTFAWGLWWRWWPKRTEQPETFENARLTPIRSLTPQCALQGAGGFGGSAQGSGAYRVLESLFELDNQSVVRFAIVPNTFPHLLKLGPHLSCELVMCPLRTKWATKLPGFQGHGTHSVEKRSPVRLILAGPAALGAQPCRHFLLLLLHAFLSFKEHYILQRRC